VSLPFQGRVVSPRRLIFGRDEKEILEKGGKMMKVRKE
jgi:hypothetical protein